jgi:signal transduction histidine kinase
VSERTKILVIDDSEDDRLLYRRCLQKSVGGSYVVSEASRGEEGLARVDTDVFACVLLDYSLPGRNGVEILKRIRARHSFVPVVMLTGQGNEKVAVAAMQEGAQNYISKATITPDTLEHVIQVAIQHCAMQKRIAEQWESLAIFARALAHDLKEPVRTIRSLLDLVSTEVSLTGKSEAHFQSITKAAERMIALIDTVYYYTRLDGTEEFDRNICDANELVEAVQDNINQLIRERGAIIDCRRLPSIFVNRAQAMQVFQNLICNAIQHGATEPRISVAAEEAADNWVFRVTDNGPGISEADIEKVFKPFKRLSRHDTQGLGLGLAICKGIVEQHGGKIWCESKSDHGATFKFTLPKAAQPAAPTVSAPAVSSTGAHRDGGQSHPLATLLLVDDNDIDIELAQILLIERNRLQCKVVVARDGHEALDRLQDANIDLMLLDINMPRMDGFELLEQMRAERMLDRVAVVMCSTSAYDEDISRALALGAAGYLTKPPEFSRLRAIVEKSTKLKISEESDALLLLRAAHQLGTREGAPRH